MCLKYSSNLEEERDRLSQLLSYDIRNNEFTTDEGFENVCDELEWVFGFDLLQSQICAYNIWKEFNATREEKSREEFFQFALKELTLGQDCHDRELSELKGLYLAI